MALHSDHASTHATRPPMRAVLLRVAASVTTAVLVPAALVWAMLVIANLRVAVVVALAWTVAAMAWRWATRRPVSGLLLLTVGILTIRTVLALVTGNAFLYFVQPVFADLVVAAVFLGSLFSTRPVVARLAPDFYPVDRALGASPRVRRLFHRLTLMWGLVVLVKAGITFALLQSLSTVHFVVIKSGAVTALTMAAVTATVLWSAVVVRRETAPAAA